MCKKTGRGKKGPEKDIRGAFSWLWKFGSFPILPWENKFSGSSGFTFWRWITLFRTPEDHRANYFFLSAKWSPGALERARLPPKGELFIASEWNIGCNAGSSILSHPCEVFRVEVILSTCHHWKGADKCLSDFHSVFPGIELLAREGKWLFQGLLVSKPLTELALLFPSLLQCTCPSERNKRLNSDLGPHGERLLGEIPRPA